ncbi:30S ribosomal protein S10 [Halobacteriaceae archaeon GCM10025711]
MTFVTKLLLQSGDRVALDAVVSDIRETARRKGAECKGPHSEAPTELHVPQYKHLDGDLSSQFSRWRYTVYTRRLEITGREDVVQSLMGRQFPDSLHIELEVEQKKPLGHTA